MNRFYTIRENIRDDTVFFSPEQTKHISTVLRIKNGENVLVFDGTGNEYEVELTKISLPAEGRIVSKKFYEAPLFRLILAQSIPKGEKMDWIIEKGTEIGVNTFIPFTSERTIVKLDEKSAAAKRARWQKIAVSAAEQSRSFFVPEIAPITSFSELLGQPGRNSLRLILWEEEKNIILKKFLKESRIADVIIFVGPEGGFSSQEIEDAKGAGILPVTLGRKILRTETAGMVAATLIHYEFEE